MPARNSLPGAPATLFLDFDGDFTGSWDGYTPGNTPAYDLDGNASSFNAQEISNIDEIWSRVAEKFSPFNLNVTTVDPGSFNNYQATKIVIGGNGAWVGQAAGGISDFYSFTDFHENLGFVFSGIWNGDTKRVAEASAHEAGHGFGLWHQSVYNQPFGKPSIEYNPGTVTKAPIMGVSYYSQRGLWWKGQSARSPLHIQDDMAVLASTSGANANLFGYRPDDHASTAAALGIQDVLSIAPDLTAEAHGVIEQTTDQDWFSFHTDGGFARLVADVAPFGAMLDLSLKLYDAGNNVLVTRETGEWNELFGMYLPAGDYKLQIYSAGNYGDVGQYFIHGSLVPEPTSLLMLAGTAALALTRRRSAR
ncbi:MAG TPA: PEP-CTERM sorting domain-containing protein [Tepidisphaeraceae bacterium]